MVNTTSTLETFITVKQVGAERLVPRRLEERRLHTERLNIREKGHSRFLRQFLSGKISDFFYSEYSKLRIWTSIKGSGNNYEKILSSF